MAQMWTTSQYGLCLSQYISLPPVNPLCLSLAYYNYQYRLGSTVLPQSLQIGRERERESDRGQVRET